MQNIESLKTGMIDLDARTDELNGYIKRLEELLQHVHIVAEVEIEGVFQLRWQRHSEAWRFVVRDGQNMHQPLLSASRELRIQCASLFEALVEQMLRVSVAELARVDSAIGRVSMLVQQLSPPTRSGDSF